MTAITARLLEELRDHKFRIGVVLAVLLLFLSHAAGLIDLRLNIGSNIAIRGKTAAQLLSGVVPDIISSLDFAVFASTGLLLSIALPICSPLRASVLTLATAIVPFYLAYSMPGKPVFIPMEYTFVMILVLYLVNVLTSYFADKHERQRLIDAFGQHVPPKIVSDISKHPDKFSMAGEAREMTVFFSDIKNFSGMSEQLDPRQLAEMLNRYFTVMTDVLHRHGATIDKYIGDAIMAFWGGTGSNR